MVWRRRQIRRTGSQWPGPGVAAGMGGARDPAGILSHGCHTRREWCTGGGDAVHTFSRQKQGSVQVETGVLWLCTVTILG